MTQVVVLEPFETGSGIAVVGDTIDIDASLARLMVTSRKARFVLADPGTPPQTFLSGTWAQMQARAAADGERWLLTNIVVRPQWWRYDAAASRWFPESGRARLCDLLGSVATPIATIGTGVTAATFFALPAPVALPANFLRVGSTLRCRALVRRSGNGGTGIVRQRVGTAGNTSDAVVVSFSMSATDGQGLRLDTESRVASQTAMVVSASASPNATGNNAISDATGQFDIQSAMQVTLGTASTNAADAFALISLQVDVEFS